MFGVSFGEILVILLVFVVLVPPAQMPSLIKDITKFIKNIQSLSNDVKSTFMEEIVDTKNSLVTSLKEVDDELEEMRKNFNPEDINVNINNNTYYGEEK